MQPDDKPGLKADIGQLKFSSDSVAQEIVEAYEELDYDPEDPKTSIAKAEVAEDLIAAKADQLRRLDRN